MQYTVSLEMHEKILNLPSYFSFEDSPEKFLKEDPSLAKRAINLLDRIKKISGMEYAFLHIQEGPHGGYCAPTLKSYRPKNQDVAKVLGSYDRGYFQRFLERQN